MSRKLLGSLNLVTPLGSSEFSQTSQATTRGTLRIAETFRSRQGEGKLAGTDSFFVRTSGCNLRCWFCDTRYASWEPEGEALEVNAIVDQVLESKLRHVILTGGEPLLFQPSVTLTQLLRRHGLHVTIETAGTVDSEAECDLLSLSPKFASSAPAQSDHPKWNRLHHQRRMPIDTMRRLIDDAPEHQVKFVVDSTADYKELLEIVRMLDSEPEDVWIMPQGTSVEEMDRAAAWLKPWASKQGFQYCDRMHIRWYGNKRGT